MSQGPNYTLIGPNTAGGTGGGPVNGTTGTYSGNVTAPEFIGTNSGSPSFVADPTGAGGQIQIGANGGGNGVVLQNNGVAQLYVVTGNGAAYTNVIAAGFKNSNGSGLSPATTASNFTITGYSANVVNVATATTATTGQSGAVFVTAGATTTIVTLPTAALGLQYTIINSSVDTTTGAQFKAAGTDKFSSTGTLYTSGGTITSTTSYSSITVVCWQAGTWQITAQNGTWSVV